MSTSEIILFVQDYAGEKILILYRNTNAVKLCVQMTDI